MIKLNCVTSGGKAHEDYLTAGLMCGNVSIKCKERDMYSNVHLDEESCKKLVGEFAEAWGWSSLALKTVKTVEIN